MKKGGLFKTQKRKNMSEIKNEAELRYGKALPFLATLPPFLSLGSFFTSPPSESLEQVRSRGKALC